jgi:hypothetical protein
MQLTGRWVHFDGQTPFIRAAQAGDVTVMRRLLDYGADPAITTHQGSTALMAAAGVNCVVAETFSRSDEEYFVQGFRPFEASTPGCPLPEGGGRNVYSCRRSRSPRRRPATPGQGGVKEDRP